MVDISAPAHESGTFEIAGKTVHRLGFGAMRLTGKGIWGEPDDRAECVRVVRRAVDLGVDLIDTADSYGPYVSEEIIREALHPYPEHVVIATKAGLVRHGPDIWEPVGRPEYLRQEAEMSLRRLGLDRIDLFQLHRIDPKVPLEDQIGLLAELQDEGKIGAIGLSEVSDRRDRRGTQDHRRRHRPEPVQPDQSQVRGRRRLLHAGDHRLHPVVPDRRGQAEPRRRPGRADRQGHRGHPGAGRARLAAGPGADRAADPRHVERRAPGGEHRRGSAPVDPRPGRRAHRSSGRRVTRTLDEQTSTSAQRTGVTGWRAVALVGAAFAITMLGTTLPTPLYPIYAARLGFGELVTTVVFAVYAVGVTAGLLLFGHWSDQLGRRPLLLAGLALSGLSAGAFLLPTALPWLFVGRVLSGLSAGIFTGTATAAIVDLAPERGRGRAGLIAAAVNMGGLGAGPVLAGVLAQYAPLPTRLCFVVDVALVGLGAGCVFAAREPVRRAETPRLRPRRLQVPRELRPTFVRAAIAGFAGFAVMGLFTAVSPAFLGTVLHHTNKALVGLVVLVVFGASVAGQTLSDAVGAGRALVWGCAALIAGMAVLVGSLAAHSLALLVAGGVIAGLGQGLSFRAGLGSVAAAAPEAVRGEVTSTFFVALYIGIAVPVIGEGALAGAFGLVPAGIAFATLVAALAGAALALLVRGVGD